MILNIAGLDVGNDEELRRVLHKHYDRGHANKIKILEINERQLGFINQCYDVYGGSVQADDGELRQALFFDPGWNEMELRIEGEL